TLIITHLILHLITLIITHPILHLLPRIIPHRILLHFFRLLQQQAIPFSFLKLFCFAALPLIYHIRQYSLCSSFFMQKA
ncbi:MAG: hypothetical protein ACLTC0_18725, partial [Eisenbergiella massiliensis]|uniref:hypothetical protein n=1 Tax=Eisenbergiella massiliensis TaxID=1720294 RepID=UPI003995A3E5